MGGLAGPRMDSWQVVGWGVRVGRWVGGSQVGCMGGWADGCVCSSWVGRWRGLGPLSGAVSVAAGVGMGGSAQVAPSLLRSRSFSESRHKLRLWLFLRVARAQHRAREPSCTGRAESRKRQDHSGTIGARRDMAPWESGGGRRGVNGSSRPGPPMGRSLDVQPRIGCVELRPLVFRMLSQASIATFPFSRYPPDSKCRS